MNIINSSQIIIRDNILYPFFKEKEKEPKVFVPSEIQQNLLTMSGMLFTKVIVDRMHPSDSSNASVVSSIDETQSLM